MNMASVPCTCGHRRGAALAQPVARGRRLRVDHIRHGGTGVQRRGVLVPLEEVLDDQAGFGLVR